MLAAEGYPSDPRRGDTISGMEASSAVDGVVVFHAGTARDEAGRLVTAGGRVLDVTALGATLAQARERAYRAASAVHWPGVHYRRDIAEAAANRAVPEPRP